MKISEFHFQDSTRIRRQFTDLYLGRRVRPKGTEGDRVVAKIRRHDTWDWNHPKELDLLRAEAIAARKASVYPGCAKIIQIGTFAPDDPMYPGQPYLISDFIDGDTLECWLKNHDAIAGTTTLMAVVKIAFKLAQTLARVHRHDLAHNDIKPSNIILRGPEDPVIIDFGAGKFYGDTAKWDEHDPYYGTPKYSSPEQLRGDAPEVNPESDVYALGLVLYEMLIGCHPFPEFKSQTTLSDLARSRGLSETQVIADFIEKRPPRFPADAERLIPGELRTICLRCLETDYRIRACAEEVAEVLGKWDRTQSNPQLQTEAPQRSKKILGQILHWKTLLLGAVAAFLTVAIIWRSCLQGRARLAKTGGNNSTVVAELESDRIPTAEHLVPETVPSSWETRGTPHVLQVRGSGTALFSTAHARSFELQFDLVVNSANSKIAIALGTNDVHSGIYLKSVVDCVFVTAHTSMEKSSMEANVQRANVGDRLAIRIDVSSNKQDFFVNGKLLSSTSAPLETNRLFLIVPPEAASTEVDFEQMLIQPVRVGRSALGNDAR